MTSRRNFLGHAMQATLALAIPAQRSSRRGRTHSRVDILRDPDAVFAQTTDAHVELTRGSDHTWSRDGVTVGADQVSRALRVTLVAPARAVQRIHLRWRGDLSAVRETLGDAWERGYGDLEWRGWVPDRVMPWYTATFDGAVTNAYGVRTGAKAFCFWNVDVDGVSLWADVRAGGQGVQLGQRRLDICDVVQRAGHAGESAFAALHEFCRQMCSNPRLPAQPVYGSNDWYWAYGKNSRESALRDTRFIVELSPVGGNRPFAVIDDGWQPGRGEDKSGAGEWDRGNEKFGDMAAVAASMKHEGARPGIWIRPLQAPVDAPDTWRSPRDRAYLDPSIPDVRAKVAADIGRIRQWGFELVKHDYSTYDIFGRWGFQMGAAMTRDGWTFASGPSRTTAEVIDDLYGTIREAAGDALVIGCNTVSHLSAGHFEMCRIGDDTSGTEWSRTRKMGVNSLAFRAAQSEAFYVADPDCVPVTTAVSWSLERQWLDLVSRSGTMTFVSLAPEALGAEQRRDLKVALAYAAKPQRIGEPLDWRTSVYPSRWTLMGEERRFDWVGPNGAGAP